MVCAMKRITRFTPEVVKQALLEWLGHRRDDPLPPDETVEIHINEDYVRLIWSEPDAQTGNAEQHDPRKGFGPGRLGDGKDGLAG
jgi:hypothetical protein